MTINFSTSLSDVTYAQQLKDVMKVLEGEKLLPYVDGTGNPTIGWGFALNQHGVDAGITFIIGMKWGRSELPRISRTLQ